MTDVVETSSAIAANPGTPQRSPGALTGPRLEQFEAEINKLKVKGGRADRERLMGVIGFCIGARSVLRTIGNHPDVFTAGVALHPSFCVTDDADSPHLVVDGFEGMLYVGYGSEDQMQPATQGKPLIDATNGLSGGRGLAEVHDGADHGFAVPGGSYHDAAADRSYEKALEFFGRVVA